MGDSLCRMKAKVGPAATTGTAHIFYTTVQNQVEYDPRVGHNATRYARNHSRRSFNSKPPSAATNLWRWRPQPNSLITKIRCRGSLEALARDGSRPCSILCRSSNPETVIALAAAIGKIPEQPPEPINHTAPHRAPNLLRPATRTEMFHKYPLSVFQSAESSTRLRSPGGFGAAHDLVMEPVDVLVPFLPW